MPGGSFRLTLRKGGGTVPFGPAMSKPKPIVVLAPSRFGEKDVCRTAVAEAMAVDAVARHARSTPTRTISRLGVCTIAVA
jgi:hypothetical protein